MSNIIPALAISATAVLGCLAMRRLFRLFHRKGVFASIASLFARLAARRVSWLVIPALVAGVFVAGVELCLYFGSSNVRNFLTECLLPFIWVGFVFSGNVHQPSMVGFYLSLFLFFFVIAFAALVVWKDITKRHEDHDA